VRNGLCPRYFLTNGKDTTPPGSALVAGVSWRASQGNLKDVFPLDLDVTDWLADCSINPADLPIFDIGLSLLDKGTHRKKGRQEPALSWKTTRSLQQSSSWVEVHLVRLVRSTVVRRLRSTTAFGAEFISIVAL
jgi:hypothetical protein